MDNKIRSFKEVFPTVSTEQTPEQVQFAQGGPWQLDHRNRHPFNNFEDDGEDWNAVIVKLASSASLVG